MHCDKFEQRLNEVLDQRGLPSDDRELRAHAERCAPCRDLLAWQQILLAGLELAEPPAMSSGFTACVLAKVAEKSAADASEGGSGSTAGIVAPASAIGPNSAGSGSATAGVNRALWWTGGIVAAALVAGYIGWELRAYYGAHGGPSGPSTPLANQNQPEQAPEPKVAAPIPAPREAAPAFVQQPVPMMNPDVPFSRLLEEAVQTLPTEEGTELASTFVDGLRPIAEPMSSMLNVVRRGLLRDGAPQEEQPRKPQAMNPLSEEVTGIG